MKHLKTYEKYIKKEYPKIPKYDIGEYVKLKNMSFTAHAWMEGEKPYPPEGVFVKIPDVGKIVGVKDKVQDSWGSYNIQLINIDNTIENIWYNYYSIKRRLNLKEIEEYELMLSTIKFNI